MIYFNGGKVNFTTFPNSERYFDLNVMVDKDNLIIFKYENDTSLMELYMFTKEIRRIYPNIHLQLAIAYMPYSRMDRSEAARVFSLKHITDFINDLDFYKVMVLEPHSDVTCALLNRSFKREVTTRLFEYAKISKMIEWNEQYDWVIFPDAGAQKNFSSGIAKNIAVCNKHRDFRTGNLTDLTIEIPNGGDLRTRNVVILDDLCSKGGTFVWAVEEILKLTGTLYKPNSVTLIVAHTEPNIFNGKIFNTNLIDTVITTNSIINESDNHYGDRLRIISFDNYINKKGDLK